MAGLYRLWARLKTFSRGLPGNAVYEGIADDRLQARLAIYQWVALSVADRRVLDLGQGGHYGEAALLAGGAREVCRDVFDLAHDSTESAASPATDSVFDKVLAVDDPVGSPHLDLSPTGLTRLIARLSPGGSLVVATGPWTGSHAAPALGVAALSWQEAIDEASRAFFLCRRFVQLAPPGYRPIWTDRSPARARSQEYRFEEIDLDAVTTEAPNPHLHQVVGEVWVLSVPEVAPTMSGPLRLHVGAGMERIEGWLNVDLLPLPGVDLELDVTRDFVFRDVDAIYAEHFLEHLEVLEVLDFLVNARKALSSEGRLRLTTPNLDWVWQTHYQRQGDEGEKIDAALSLNRAFYGWEHRFLWNRETLSHVLRVCGFTDLEWPRWGESQIEHLRDLERHEQYPDNAELPHVLVVEASKGKPDEEGLARFRERLDSELVAPMKGWQAVDLSVSRSTPRVMPREPTNQED